MLRLMIIVARDRLDLLDYFECVLSGMADVKVVRDRRMIPPAMQDAPSDSGQRGGWDIYDELQHRGFVIVRL